MAVPWSFEELLELDEGQDVAAGMVPERRGGRYEALLEEGCLVAHCMAVYEMVSM